MITPAISVLGALEGLEVATPIFRPWIVPLPSASCSRSFWSSAGTAGIGAVFGPVMLALVRRDRGPRHSVRSCGTPRCWRRSIRSTRRASSSRNGIHGFLLLGSVVLCITGGEALYADMGHFGRRPIRIAWYARRLPGAAPQLLRPGRAAAREAGRGDGESVLRARPGRCSSTRWSILRTVAAVIASQALISGAFSLTQQAVQLGYFPRVSIVHTSDGGRGPDLRPRGQLAADGRLRRAGGRLPRILEPRRGLRHRGDRHDGHHVASCSSRRARRRWGWSARRGRAALGRLPARRPRVLRARTSRRSPTAAGSRCSSA